jgi:hypothetical protein
MAVEEHGGGRQFVRFRFWPRLQPFLLALLALLAAGSADAGLGRAKIACAFLAASTLLVAFQVVRQCGAALAAINRAVRQIDARERVASQAGEDRAQVQIHGEQVQVEQVQ